MTLKRDAACTLTWRGLFALLALAVVLPLAVGLAAPTLNQPLSAEDEPQPETPPTARANPAQQADPQRRDVFVRRMEAAVKTTSEKDLTDARDEVEILQAQVGVKRAQLRSAQVALPPSQARLNRATKAHSSGAMSAEEFEQAKADAAAAEAQIAIKEAELVVSEVQLKQAERRLKALETSAKQDAKTTGQKARERLSAMEAAKAAAEELQRVQIEDARQVKAQRERALQAKIEALQKQLDALREELNPKTPKK